MTLCRRIAALEAQPTSLPFLHPSCPEWLRDEAVRLAKVRAATRELTALMWKMAGRPERAAAVKRGEGYLPDEWTEAVKALDAQAQTRLERGLRALLAARTRSLSSAAEPGAAPP